MDLFEYGYKQKLKKSSPLAVRLRPKTLDDIVGQSHILGKDKLLYRAISADRLSSIILYGPTGSGKTTIAKVISNTTKADFKQLNATISGKKDIVSTVEDAKYLMSTTGRKTIVFIDEIHRFNKAQQDTLLPYVEDGTIVLIGATTENPYFEVNRALISRSKIFKLEPLSKDDIKEILKRALNREDGLKSFNVSISENVLDFLSDMSGGDVRVALSGLELAVLTTDKKDDKVVIDLEIAKECIQNKSIRYDKDGDLHYDTISAFIKSMRGSNPHAAVYYLARMLEAGEDVKFIARRIVICASEDVGNADPNALVVAVSAAQAVDFIGMPEAKIILSQAVTYIATAPKSNASLCIFDALEDVKQISIDGVPAHLRDAHYKDAHKLGSGIGYKYPHNYENNYVKQQYLPDELEGKCYYKPTENGYEKNIKDMMEQKS